MKRLLSLLMVTAFMYIGFSACGQDNKEARPSPPAKVTGTAGGANVTIDYSQPSVKGRKIFGGLEPWGKVWRAGANEATTIEFDKDVKINGQALPKGKYAFFAIPNENEWTLIFNKTASQWGAFRYKQEDDALRVKVQPAKTPSLVEKLNYTIGGNKVTLAWENTAVSFNVE